MRPSLRDLAGHDPYELLGVTPGADDREIVAAHRQRVRQLHPDRPGGDEEQTKLLHLARAVLLDPARRAEYDRLARRRSDGSDRSTDGDTGDARRADGPRRHPEPPRSEWDGEDGVDGAVPSGGRPDPEPSSWSRYAGWPDGEPPPYARRPETDPPYPPPYSPSSFPGLDDPEADPWNGLPPYREPGDPGPPWAPPSAQSGWDVPSYPAPPPAATRTSGSTLGIVALVSALVCGPVGLVLGLVALSRRPPKGSADRIRAIVAICLSGASTLCFGMFILMKMAQTALG